MLYSAKFWKEWTLLGWSSHRRQIGVTVPERRWLSVTLVRFQLLDVVLVHFVGRGFWFGFCSWTRGKGEETLLLYGNFHFTILRWVQYLFVSILNLQTPSSHLYSSRFIVWVGVELKKFVSDLIGILKPKWIFHVELDCDKTPGIFHEMHDQILILLRVNCVMLSQSNSSVS